MKVEFELVDINCFFVVIDKGVWVFGFFDKVEVVIGVVFVGVYDEMLGNLNEVVV